MMTEREIMSLGYYETKTLLATFIDLTMRRDRDYAGMSRAENLEYAQLFYILTTIGFDLKQVKYATRYAIDFTVPFRNTGTYIGFEFVGDRSSNLDVYDSLTQQWKKKGHYI